MSASDRSIFIWRGEWPETLAWLDRLGYRVPIGGRPAVTVVPAAVSGERWLHVCTPAGCRALRPGGLVTWDHVARVFQVAVAPIYGCRICEHENIERVSGCEIPGCDGLTEPALGHWHCPTCVVDGRVCSTAGCWPQARAMCEECCVPDDDPVTWCDCQRGAGEPPCRSIPCKQRAHSPERCPTLGEDVR